MKYFENRLKVVSEINKILKPNAIDGVSKLQCSMFKEKIFDFINVVPYFQENQEVLEGLKRYESLMNACEYDDRQQFRREQYEDASRYLIDALSVIKWS